MSSREKILNAIRKNKPAENPLPNTFSVPVDEGGLTEKFTAVLQGIGGKAIPVQSPAEVEACLQSLSEKERPLVCCWDALAQYNAEEYRSKAAAETEAVYAVCIKASLAVAENAAVWVTEKEMMNRMLPFICQELLLVVEEENIVANMHEAYKKLQVDGEGFGTFIAGPSKTADIEQSLVIGAHGPLGLQVFVLG